MSFTYFTNRAETIFRAALEPLGGECWQAGQDTGKDGVDLLYFDQYGGQQAPAGLNSRFGLIDRANTIPLDHKLQLAQTLKQNNIDFPRHYFSPVEVPEEPKTLWYIKDPLSSGGKRIWLCRYEELVEYFQPGYLIQEAITKPRLHLGRKFTLRTYVLVCNRIVYLYPDSFLVLHATPYDSSKTDPEAHFSHIGYMQPESKIKLIPSSEYKHAFKLLMPIEETIQKVFGLFDERLGKNNPANSFCLFGLDMLPCEDGSVALIEINDRPNFHHTNEINTKVNQPMLQAMCRLLLPDKVSSTSGKCFDELMFYE